MTRWFAGLSAFLLVGAACGLLGQPVDTRPEFEVASVKADKSETGVDRIEISNGSLIIANVSLKRCIGLAYGVAEGRDDLFSGPDWMDAERLDILAKFPPETPNPQVLLMLQRLLDERFKLSLHRESRAFSTYALVVGKNGAKLHPSAVSERNYKFRAQSGHASGVLSMPMFAGRLSKPPFELGRPVVDFTGLTGMFDLSLDWKPEGGQADNPPENVSDASIFAAIQEQLGLRLESRKVELDVLVVDHANKIPTEN